MKLHTEVFGQGEPIVFLHTGLQTGMKDFEYQREFLKDKYQVILPDLRGHGKSKADDFSNFFEDSAQDLIETMEAMNVESAHIVDCSLGALVGLALAKKEAPKVKSLTLSGVLPEKPEKWSALHKKDVEHQKSILEHPETISYFDTLHHSDWRELLNLAQDENWYPFNLTGHLDGMTSPVLYMVGEGNKTETKGALLYPAMKEDVHVCIIPFAAHLVHDEQPEIYTKVLERFLQEVSG